MHALGDDVKYSSGIALIPIFKWKELPERPRNPRCPTKIGRAWHEHPFTMESDNSDSERVFFPSCAYSLFRSHGTVISPRRTHYRACICLGYVYRELQRCCKNYLGFSEDVHLPFENRCSLLWSLRALWCLLHTVYWLRPWPLSGTWLRRHLYICSYCDHAYST